MLSRKIISLLASRSPVQKVLFFYCAWLFVGNPLFNAAEQPLCAKSLNFIDDDFEKFVNRIVLDTQAQTPFKAYYTNLSEKLKNDEHQRKATYRYLLRLAMANLRATHVDWYNAIEPYVTDEEKTNDSTQNDKRIKVTIFLIRYGAYEEFKSLARANDVVTAQNFQKTTVVQEGWWDSMKSTIKSLFSSVSNTVAGWFGYGDQQTA